MAVVDLPIRKVDSKPVPLAAVRTCPQGLHYLNMFLTESEVKYPKANTELLHGQFDDEYGYYIVSGGYLFSDVCLDITDLDNWVQWWYGEGRAKGQEG